MIDETAVQHHQKKHYGLLNDEQCGTAVFHLPVGWGKVWGRYGRTQLLNKGTFALISRRFSFVTTVIIMLAILFLVTFGPYRLFELVGIPLPSWIVTPLAFLGIYIALEIAARIGPKAFDTKLDEMVGEHNHYRNKMAMMLFILTPITLIEYQRAQQNINSFWHGLFLFLVGMLMGYLFALIVGTPDFRKSLLPKPLRGKS